MQSPLRRIRLAYGLRVVDIAAAAGVSIDTIRRIDRLDVVTLKLSSLVKVARAVGVAPTDLVPGLARKPRSASLMSPSSCPPRMSNADWSWPSITPKISLDTNGLERALRGAAVGRKNHYGSRSERGTRVTALLYSLIESAKLAGVKPRGYLGRGGPSGDQSLETRSGEVVISARPDAQR
jgi:transcriptional regulator with XRE-family HTH domain